MKEERSDRSLKLIYGQELYDRITNSKVLIGGSGGVGCEIIKSLGKSGFRNFTIIDLDTIEMTNLNRQFYFRRHHVGKGKSECAKEGVLEIEPTILNVEAILANIFEERFNNSFYSQFNLAFCAFDNQAARRHFGKKCVANNIPMVEAGTSAYHGDVSTRVKGLFECRNCKPEIKQVVFNVCSIRTRPSEPIHCIVWASSMYNLIFGPKDGENVLENYISEIFLEGISNVQDPVQKSISLFDKIFNEDIQKCDEKVRFPISFQEAILINNVEDTQTVCERTGRQLLEDECIFTIRGYAEKFVVAFTDILRCRHNLLGDLKFDKDDQLALRFIASIVNLRTYNFRNLNNQLNKLKYLSEHTIKQMAGNIIPAIASTNAIVSGIQVTEAIKIMKGYQNTHPHLLCEYLVQNDINSKISPVLQNVLTSFASKENSYLIAPYLTCAACSPANCFITLRANCKNLTFGQLKEYFESQYFAHAQIIQFQGHTIYNPFISSLEEIQNRLLAKKISEFEKFSPLEMNFRLFNTTSLINWQFTLIHDENIPDSTIVFKPDSSPQNITRQHIQYIKLKHEEDLQQKFFFFNKFKYIGD